MKKEKKPNEKNMTNIQKLAILLGAFSVDEMNFLKIRRNKNKKKQSKWNDMTNIQKAIFMVRVHSFDIF